MVRTWLASVSSDEMLIETSCLSQWLPTEIRKPRREDGGGASGKKPAITSKAKERPSKAKREGLLGFGSYDVFLDCFDNTIRPSKPLSRYVALRARRKILHRLRCILIRNAGNCLLAMIRTRSLGCCHASMSVTPFLVLLRCTHARSRAVSRL